MLHFWVFGASSCFRVSARTKETGSVDRRCFMLQHEYDFLCFQCFLLKRFSNILMLCISKESRNTMIVFIRSSLGDEK